MVKVTLPLRGKTPTLLLERTLPTPSLWELGGHQLVQPGEQAEVDARITQFSIESHALSTFMGRPMAMRGLVVTPPDRQGRISDEAVFYLTSRGISEDEARAMIVRGFVEPIARELPMEYALELNRLIEIQMEGSVG